MGAGLQPPFPPSIESNPELSILFVFLSAQCSKTHPSISTHTQLLSHSCRINVNNVGQCITIYTCIITVSV